MVPLLNIIYLSIVTQGQEFGKEAQRAPSTVCANTYGKMQLGAEVKCQIGTHMVSPTSPAQPSLRPVSSIASPGPG